MRVHRLLVASIVVGLLVTGCGGDPTTADGADTGTSAAASDTAGGAFPVTIDHARGSTTLEQRPERIVTLSVQWTDAVVAMEVEPLAYLLDQAQGEEEPYPWQEGRLDGATRIDASGEVPFERIAALEPDLILVAYAATDPEVADRLEAIAPTIGMLGDREVDRWQDQVEVVGRVLGEPDRAAEVTADVAQLVADTAAEVGGLDGATYLLANYVPGDSIYVVADPDDGAAELFDGLGMTIAPDLLEVADSAVGRIQLGLEQAGMLESDLLAILTNGGDPHDLPGYDELTSVRTGAVAEMELADVVGVNTPTPLSVPHVLELLRPALEVVAAS